LCKIAQKGEIGKRVFLLLGEKRISQTKLAEATGIPVGTISNWNKKSTNPSADKISVIAGFFGVSTEWLLTGEEKNASSTIAGDISGSAFVQGTNRGSVTVHNGREHQISEEAAELLKLYEGLPLKKRVKLLQTAIDLSESED